MIVRDIDQLELEARVLAGRRDEQQGQGDVQADEVAGIAGLTALSSVIDTYL
jgi:hypothetical protein